MIILTLILLTWKIWWAPNNASRWQMGFNSAFEGTRRNRWSGYVARMRFKSPHIWSNYLNERTHLLDVVIDGKIILNCLWNRAWIGISCHITGSIVGADVSQNSDHQRLKTVPPPSTVRFPLRRGSPLITWLTVTRVTRECDCITERDKWAATARVLADSIP